MQIVFWIIWVITLITGLIYFGKCQLQEEKIYELEDKLYESKAIKHRAEIMLIKDEVEKYKKGGNPFTALAKISDVINKTALDGDQTD